MQFPDRIVPGAEDLITAQDPRDFDARSRFTERLPRDLEAFRYELRDRSLLKRRFDRPLTIHSRLNAGDLHLTRIVDRFQTEVKIVGDGLSRYWFGIVNEGRVQLRQGTQAVEASGSTGIALRGIPGTQLLGTDHNVRTSLWVEADALERMLAAMLDGDPRQPIAFRPIVDWSYGLAQSLLGLLDVLVADAARPDGLMANDIAFASFNDALLRVILLGLPHDRSEQLARLSHATVPRSVRRAEDYMRAHAHRALRMEEVALAAGCSLRVLESSYARARGLTPSAALRAIRLDAARETLRRGEAESIAAVARRHGFTNAGRFAAAYRERFGEFPSDAAAFRSRSVGFGRDG